MSADIGRTVTLIAVGVTLLASCNPSSAVFSATAQQPAPTINPTLVASLPSIDLAQIKAHCMVHKARMDAYDFPTPTPTSSPRPFFSPRLNVYCRSGPHASEGQISLAMMGQSYPIHGRNRDGTWYLLRLSVSSECWVSAETGTVSGDISEVRVIWPTATPESAAAGPVVNCGQYATPQSCAQHVECRWIPSMAAGNCRAQ